MGYDVTRAKLRQNAHCLEICVILRFSANNNRNSRHAAAACFALAFPFRKIYNDSFFQSREFFVKVKNCFSLS